MKLLFKPFSIVLGLLSGLVASKIFNAIWGIFDEEEPPKPTTRDTSWGKVLSAAAVQGITFKVTRALVDRNLARGFAFLTGSWPGPKTTEPSAAAKAVR
jgi:hypothetical protein